MNAIAASQLGGVTVISATVSHDVAPYSEVGQDVSFTAIDSFSMPGRGPLKIIRDKWSYVRRLVRVENCSIKWFGVLFNAPGGTAQFGSVPHIYFTPHPSQGRPPYLDPGYDSFTTWRKLWHDYTQAPGRQIVTAGKDQVLVVPFYTNAQHRGGLGDFLSNWKETVTTVVTAAIDSIDPTALRNRFEFDEIYSTSFSDGSDSPSPVSYGGLGGPGHDDAGHRSRWTGSASALALAAGPRHRVPRPGAAALGQSGGHRMVCRRSLDSTDHDGRLAWRVHRSRRVLKLSALPWNAPLETQVPIRPVPFHLALGCTGRSILAPDVFGLGRELGLALAECVTTSCARRR